MGRQFDLPYMVEQWDDNDSHVEELIALTWPGLLRPCNARLADRALHTENCHAERCATTKSGKHRDIEKDADRSRRRPRRPRAFGALPRPAASNS